MIIEGDIDRAARLHSPFSLAFAQAERELGERIGYPALVYGTQPYHTASASAGYVSVFSPAGELSAQEQVARLNELEAQVQALRKQMPPPRERPIVNHGAARFEVQGDGRRRAVFDRMEDAEFFCDASEEIVNLRLALAAAHEHVGTLVAAIAAARTAEDAFFRDSTRANARAAEDAQVTLIRAESAAGAWLRRGAE